MAQSTSPSYGKPQGSQQAIEVRPGALYLTVYENQMLSERTR